MDKHEFMSPQWNAAAHGLAGEYKDRIDAPGDPVKMNIVVTETPFGPDELLAYVDTHTGHPFPEEGALADADLTVTMGYEVARAIFVEADETNLGSAFMSGKIKITGDMSRLMFLFDLELDDDQLELSREFGQKLRDLTA